MSGWKACRSGVGTAQGIAFDYVGVIIGRDLRWDPATNAWICDSGCSHDSIVKRSDTRFTDLVKRTCRVLLTRGLKGCYVSIGDGTPGLWTDGAMASKEAR